METNDHTALREPTFLPIQRLGAIAYGGDQAWFPSAHLRRTACGSVALADITAYAALYGGLPQLYGGDMENPLSGSSFLQHMEGVARDLTPRTIGIPFVNWWKEGALRYFRRRNVLLEDWHGLEGPYPGAAGAERAERFLRGQIHQNRPVACLHWFGAAALPVIEGPGGAKTADMNLHWVVVTALSRQGDEGRVTVSSCGQRYVFRLKDFLRGGPAFITPAFCQPSDAH